MGAQPNENYMRCVIKGLYDPARIAKLLESTGDFEKREAAGHAVYADKQGEMQICLLDAEHVPGRHHEQVRETRRHGEASSAR